MITPEPHVNYFDIPPVFISTPTYADTYRHSHLTWDILIIRRQPPLTADFYPGDMGFRDASKFSRIAFGLAVGGFLTDIIGFPSPYWVARVDSSSGLFQACFLGDCQSGSLSMLPGWWKGVIALEVLGFLACLGSFVLMVLYVHVKNDQKIFQTMATGLAFAAAGLILIGIIIFGAELSGSSFGWSFGMTIISGLFHIGVGVLNVVDKASS